MGELETLRGIASALEVPCPFEFQEVYIKELAIDSRKVMLPKQSLFFAIKGDRHDGHNFIDHLYEQGVRAFVVSTDYLASEKLDDAFFIHVENPLAALQTVAAAKRAQYNYPLIGITGSNGKTIVKEWLYQLLDSTYNIIRSPKSYNSQVGVPLSVWRMKSENDLAIIEAGISMPGEMVKLERIIRPTIGIFTNLGQAHDENFSDANQKAREKLDLFQNVETLIYCKDYLIIQEELDHYPFTSSPKLFAWSRRTAADLQIGRIEKRDGQTEIQGIYQHNFIRIRIPFTDEASIENAIHCWAVMLLFGFAAEDIQKRMEQLAPVAMRLELKQGINNCSVINDSYNSDLQSISIALDFLSQQHQHPKRTLVLSDILQTGRPDNELYAEVAQLVREKKVDRLIGIGNHISGQAQLFDHSSEFFASTDDFLDAYHHDKFYNETILLKGARSFGFEAISRIIQHKTHQTVLEIDLGAMVHNLNLIRSLLKPETKLMAMVKAFGYGSGSFEIANILQFHHVDYLAVAYADEGIELRKAGISLPIMVISPEEQSFDAMIQYGLEPEIFSVRSLQLLENAIKRKGTLESPLKIHVKLNTGMNRLGFSERDINAMVVRIKNNPQLRLASVFSHLAASENQAEDAFSREQIARFEQMSNAILSHFNYPVLRHICNSFGIIRFPEAQYEMVRLGIGLYGVAPESPITGKLRNVSTLRTTISQIHELKTGDTIGYGRTEKVQGEMRSATLPIGYADGLSRKNGNRQGSVLINGHRASIVGNVCMDMCMVDVTGVPCKEGDDVVIFGEDYSIEEFATNSETIAYEVLTNVSARVKRVYFQE
ncbi:MAG: bifunctional UDP-N-acetylmuramoyl-tripeptide:D-alanyl-D-alanine ligase/alanine racemase [Flavobacteriales bacterium]|nr:bifunctional UDP-N-acetylmuramoyl-tripeptide:D-alanyl-D-alanine ligase/alanine racemase [Flavobacteriales bacterium]